MAGNLKGLTIELDGDTTKLSKALEDVNKKSRDLSSELGQINKMLKFDPGNADLLAQKQKVLAEAIENTRQKLDTLKEAEQQVQAQFERGEIGEEQYRALQREIISTEQKLGQYENAAKETADALEDLGRESDDAADSQGDLGDSAKDAGDSAKDAEGGFTILKGTLADLASSAIQSVLGSLKELAGSLFELSEATREYRESMAQLDTAYTTNGHSTELAAQAYQNFYRLLGETDTATEASNLLAQLARNGEDVDSWYRIAAGTLAKFPDSIPTEGLIEAANETAKVGTVTGVMADAIKWATVSNEQWNAILGEGTPQQQAFAKAIEGGATAEDAFNAALAECATEQDRASFITETMLGLYGSAGDTYNEMTEGIQNARDAEADLAETQGQLGSAIEPVTTAFTNLKNMALQALVPVVEALSQKFQELQQWLQEHPAAAQALTAVVLGLAAAFAVLAGATAIAALVSLIPKVTAAMQALNLAFLANPITLIVAAIAGLVAAFVYLWQNCEGFREFWIGLWETIKSAAQTAWEAIKGFFTSAAEALMTAWNGVLAFFTTLWEGIKLAFAGVVEFFSSIFSTAWNAIQSVWNAVTGFFSGIWEGIKSVFAAVVEYFTERFQTAYAGVTAIWNAVTGFFSGIWQGIQNVFAAVGSWFRSKFQEAYAGVTAIWNAAKSFFSGIWSGIQGVFSSIGSWFRSKFQEAYTNVTNVWNGIKSFFTQKKEEIFNAFSNVGAKFAEIGSNIVDGIKNGIRQGWDTLTGWVRDKANSLLDAAKSALGINSPSKEFAKVGRYSAEGIAVGLEEAEDMPVKAAARVAHMTLDSAADEVDGQALTRNIGARVAASAAETAQTPAWADKLDRILEAIERGQVLTIDGKTLVGATANRYDATLGQRRALAARGAV